jgi:hypothetical protein
MNIAIGLLKIRNHQRKSATLGKHTNVYCKVHPLSGISETRQCYKIAPHPYHVYPVITSLAKSYDTQTSAPLNNWQFNSIDALNRLAIQIAESQLMLASKP